MGEHAGLRRNLQHLAHSSIEQQLPAALRAVGDGIDPDDGVAAPEQQPVDNAGEHALGVVRRMIGLNARRKRPGKAERVAKARDDADLRGNRDQILIARDFRHGGRHLGRYSR